MGTQRSHASVLWIIAGGFFVAVMLLGAISSLILGDDSPAEPQAYVEHNTPVSKGCTDLVETAERVGAIHAGTLDSSGMTILVDESFARAGADYQRMMAECVSHYVARSQDKWIRKVSFVNQRTGVTYGTIENTRYRIGP